LDSRIGASAGRRLFPGLTSSENFGLARDTDLLTVMEWDEFATMLVLGVLGGMLVYVLTFGIH
jgi:hypothetical protein